MSVYTEVSETDLKKLLSEYHAGTLKSYAGIHDGIENTNYFVTTDQGEYVLTIFEHMPEAEVRFSLQLMTHLASNHLPCPSPLQNQHGQSIGHLTDKAFCLVQRLHGKSVMDISADHCKQIGKTLAKFHLLSRSISEARPNPRGMMWFGSITDELLASLDQDLQQLLLEELSYQQRNQPELPAGIIHADLFRDNVLFSAGKLTGLLDLYDTCYDFYLYDLAVTATDWCTLPDGSFERGRLQQLLRAYYYERPVTEDEQRCWPIILRRAALRFLLSRLHNRHFPRDSYLTRDKDPVIYQQILEHCRNTTQNWPL